jgi:hypothetical protein
MRSLRMVGMALVLAAAALAISGCRPVCGDGLCEVEEEGRCSADCYCGDGLCARNENSTSCGTDCGGTTPPTQYCGNGVCEGTETFSTCPGDCDPPQTCDWDGRCDPGEDYDSCPSDCPPEWDCFCGDGFCDLTCEDSFTCYDDCGYCGDGWCNGPEDVWSCDRDCNGYCGDGYCESGEEGVCPADCGCPWDYPYACGDQCWNCAGGLYINCCYGSAYVCYTPGYPYYCPATGVCWSTISEWSMYCPDWTACTDYGRSC